MNVPPANDELPRSSATRRLLSLPPRRAHPAPISRTEPEFHKGNVRAEYPAHPRKFPTAPNPAEARTHTERRLSVQLPLGLHDPSSDCELRGKDRHKNRQGCKFYSPPAACRALETLPKPLSTGP